MGFKPWHYLSLLALAGAGLVGCNSTNPPNKSLEKPPPGNMQTTQRPPGYPGTMNANQSAFPLANNAQRPVFAPAPPAGNLSNAAGQSPTMPTTNSGFSQNPGNPVSQSSTFAPLPAPQIPAFPAMNNQPGLMPLPGPRANDTLPANSSLFPAPPNNLPVAPPTGGSFPPR